MIDYNPFSLEGKKILITGASSGIGKATAIECSRLGATVVLTARNEERLKEVLDDLSGEGHSYIVADINEEEQIKKIAEEVTELDGLVCNAGIGITKPVAFFKQGDLQKVFDTNLFAPTLLVKHLLKKKAIKKGASIVFTSFISAHVSTMGIGIYAATKAAISSYMRTCAVELASKNIRSNANLPGMVETKLIAPGTLTTEDLDKDKQRYPLGRYGKPEEIAYAMVYLLSDATRWITGTELIIDGGFHLI